MVSHVHNVNHVRHQVLSCAAYDMLLRSLCKGPLRSWDCRTTGSSCVQIYAMVKGKPYGEGQLMSAAARQGKMSQMRAAVSKHRQTWVTEADFKLMASKSINAVRIPVGYWVMAEHPWQVRVAFGRHVNQELERRGLQAGN